MSKLWKVRFAWEVRFTEEYTAEQTKQAFESKHPTLGRHWWNDPVNGEAVIIMSGDDLAGVSSRAEQAARGRVPEFYLQEKWQTPKIEIKHIELFVNGDGVAYEYAR